MLPNDMTIAVITGKYRRRRPWLSGLLTLVFLLMTTAWGHGFDPSAAYSPVREMRAGLAIHDVDRLWSQSSKEKGPDIIGEVVFNYALLSFHSITAYPNLGFSLNTQGDTSKFYGGFLLQWEPASRFFLSTGFGLALHNGKRDTDEADRKSLGSQVLFRIPIEIGYIINRHHRIVLAFDHISNAHLASPNEGLDTLGLVYGYVF